MILFRISSKYYPSIDFWEDLEQWHVLDLVFSTTRIRDFAWLVYGSGKDLIFIHSSWDPESSSGLQCSHSSDYHVESIELQISSEDYRRQWCRSESCRFAQYFCLSNTSLFLFSMKLVAAKIMEMGPVLVVNFQAQQIAYITDATGKVVEGDAVSETRRNGQERVFYWWRTSRNKSTESIMSSPWVVTRLFSIH